MRTQFIKHGNHEAIYVPAQNGIYIDENGDKFMGLPGVVANDAPWSAIVVKVDGGYIAFESIVDYQTWTKQI